MRKKFAEYNSTKHEIYPSISTKGSLFAKIQGLGMSAVLLEKTTTTTTTGRELILSAWSPVFLDTNFLVSSCSIALPDHFYQMCTGKGTGSVFFSASTQFMCNLIYQLTKFRENLRFILTFLRLFGNTVHF